MEAWFEEEALEELRELLKDVGAKKGEAEVGGLLLVLDD